MFGLSEKDRKLIINITLVGIIIVFVLAFIFFPKQKDAFRDSPIQFSFSTSHQIEHLWKNDSPYL